MKLNFIIIPFSVLGYLLLTEGYNLFWGDIYADGMSFIVFMITFVVGIVVHEALHGFTWMWAGNLRLSDIKYGFIWKAMMPFAHSKKPLRKRAYQLGAAMPGLVLGVLPYLLGLLIGNSYVATMGMIMTLCAGGDVWILWMIRKEPVDAFIFDHPNKPGCYVIEPASDSISIDNAVTS